MNLIIFRSFIGQEVSQATAVMLRLLGLLEPAEGLTLAAEGSFGKVWYALDDTAVLNVLRCSSVEVEAGD